MPTLEEINKSTEDMLKRMEVLHNLMTRPNGLVRLYLETVPRSFIELTPEDDAKREGDGPWTVKDQVTGHLVTVQRAECGLGCKCALGVGRCQTATEIPARFGGAVMQTPEGGWLGLMIEVARKSTCDDDFDEKLAKRLEELQVDGRVWDLLVRYSWKDAKSAAFCAPNIRMMVERLGGPTISPWTLFHKHFQLGVSKSPTTAACWPERV